MSEFRQDLVSGDWVIISPGRTARPHFLDEKKPTRKAGLKATCPFDHPQKTGNWPPLYAWPNEKNWHAIVLKNKYPILERGGMKGAGADKNHGDDSAHSILFRRGIYTGRTAVGDHQLIITRDHSKNFAALSPADAAEVLTIFQKQCDNVARDPYAVYAIPFFNWGVLAGASVWHPHYQFLSLPIIPAHNDRSLRGAEAYWKKNKRCARCDVIVFERKEKSRVIEENALAIAIAPYASKFQFEMNIMLKKHSSYFYRASKKEIAAIASLLQSILRRMKKNLNDPDYNVFIHESPLNGQPHDYHHWHVEIIPRTSTPAGFEFSTGMYINAIEPEKVAGMLRHKLK